MFFVAVNAVNALSTMCFDDCTDTMIVCRMIAKVTQKMNKGGFGCTIAFFTTSFVFYIISMSVGWVLYRLVPPINNTILAGAVINTVSAISVFGYVILLVMFGSGKVGKVPVAIMIGFVIIAGLLEFTGGILFIVAGAQSGDHGLIAYGTSAGVFGIFAAFSCWCSPFICWFGRESDDSR